MDQRRARRRERPRRSQIVRKDIVGGRVPPPAPPNPPPPPPPPPLRRSCVLDGRATDRQRRRGSWVRAPNTSDLFITSTSVVATGGRTTSSSAGTRPRARRSEHVAAGDIACPPVPVVPPAPGRHGERANTGLPPGRQRAAGGGYFASTRTTKRVRRSHPGEGLVQLLPIPGTPENMVQSTRRRHHLRHQVRPFTQRTRPGAS